MSRRATFSELRWPDDPFDHDLPIRWASGVATRVLDWTWRAFDLLRAKHLARVDLTQGLEQLERDLTRSHFIEILALFASETSGFPTFFPVPVPEWPELESRTSPSAKPPANDFAFVSYSNRRWTWPIEAKVVPTPGRLGDYLEDVNRKFVGGVAAPLVGEGAMIAYLLTNETDKVFENLARRLEQVLEPVSEFRERPHRTSHHSRATAPDLRLHHMMMECVAR
ncbi:MAG TPA: hypothetical protein VND64_32665 [Pirellulales bacterium]|nr:hypothetical protein [Pirellulales bacterium]